MASVARTPISDFPSRAASVWTSEEIDLMLRVKRDEPGAFAELVGQYWTRVFARFFRWLHDRQEAEDLAQEVFLRLYRSRKRYLPKAHFTTWLFHISQNVARNALRSRKRRPLISLGKFVEGNEGMPLQLPRTEREQSPSEPLEMRELAAIVHAALGDLASRQRTALELHQFQQQSYAQIALQMDMSPKAAKSLLYRARNQLRETLRDALESS